jgi:pimeloyl-ACP methyl ester carboxylesterase
MLQKIIFLLLAIVVGLPLTATGQDRNVVWVHGFNASSNDWLNFRNQFNGSHRITGFAPLNYSSRTGLQTFANEIGGRNSAAFVAASRPIIIGHSMGGAAARRLDFTQDVGGIITVGSPLDGAGVATAVNNGAGTAEITNGVNQVGRGPIATFSPLPAVLGLKASDIIEGFRVIGSVVTGKSISDPLAFTADAYGQASVDDLQIGGLTAPKSASMVTFQVPFTGKW